MFELQIRLGFSVSTQLYMYKLPEWKSTTSVCGVSTSVVSVVLETIHPHLQAEAEFPGCRNCSNWETFWTTSPATSCEQQVFVRLRALWVILIEKLRIFLLDTLNFGPARNRVRCETNWIGLKGLSKLEVFEFFCETTNECCILLEPCCISSYWHTFLGMTCWLSIWTRRAPFEKWDALLAVTFVVGQDDCFEPSPQNGKSCNFSLLLRWILIEKHVEKKICFPVCVSWLRWGAW